MPRIISSNFWRRLRNSPDQQSTYICQLRIFNYWQVYKREVFDQAFACIRKRQAVEPDSPAVLTSLTFLYVESIRTRYQLLDPDLATRTQLLDRALKTANMAIQAAPDSARSHSAMAAAFMINQNIPAAVASAREAIKRNPNDPELLADLGAKLVQAGSYREALDLLNRVIALGGAQPQWRNIFAALCNYMIGENKELARLACVLKKDECLLVSVIQLLNAVNMKNVADIQAAREALNAIAPNGRA